jgi:hypothetical protein
LDAPDLRALFGSAPGPFGRALPNGPGFSVGLGLTTPREDQSLRVAADSGWGAPLALLRGAAARTVTLVDPATALTVTVTYVRHAGHDGATTALSWRGWIENHGTEPVERLTRVAMLDVALPLEEGAAGDPTVRSMRGGVSHSFFPPDAFSVSERTLLHTYRPAIVELDSGGTGRSTDGDVPYVVVSTAAGVGGCFVALGWSGLWTLRIVRSGARLSLEGSIDGLDLTLAPGERLPLPETLLGFYAGDMDAGANALRRVLRRDFVPLLDGAPVAPPVSYDHWFEFRLNVHEDALRPQVAACAALGVEYFVVDAGWFAGSEASYRRGCGNWGREASHRFPSGLRALADEVRAHGMRFGLWIDPELAHPDSDVGRAHPEWLLHAPDAEDGVAVVDFSQPAARDWAVDTILDLVQRYGLGWLRWDVNVPLAPHWRHNDAPGRAGWRQVQHVAGVHEILDRVLARCPGLLLEACCGGGRRMDLGLLRRSHTMWCSDLTTPAAVVRAHQSGGNRLLPAGAFNTNLLYGPADPAEPAAFPRVAWLSHMGGPLGFSGDFRSWTTAQLRAGREYVDAFKRRRHLLAGDFQPLFPMPRRLDDPDGWRFGDPDTGEALTVTFAGGDAQWEHTPPHPR